MGLFDNMALTGNKEADQTLAGIGSGLFSSTLDRLGISTPNGTRQPATTIPTNTGRPASQASQAAPVAPMPWYQTKAGKIGIAAAVALVVVVVAVKMK